MLNKDVLNDLIVLNAGIRMGIGKLERWVEFQKEAAKDTTGAATAAPSVVAEVLDDMAKTMEKQPKYFDPELPRSFRWLIEASRDPAGATKTTTYGAVRSAENVFIFLGQRALGIGKGSVEAVEKHISKGVAAGLMVLFGDSALRLAELVPGGLSWIKTALEAIAKTKKNDE